MTVEALAKTLPDDTHLTELHIEDGKVQIVGLSGDAPALIRLIEQSRRFTRATFLRAYRQSVQRRRDFSHRGSHRAIICGDGLTLISISGLAADRRQTLAVLVYVCVVIALSAASLWLVDDLWARSREIAATQERLDQLTEHSRPRPPASIATDASVNGSPFLDGRTITIAGAALEQRVGAAVTKAGGVLISSQVELDGPEAKNGFVTLTATIEVAQPALQTILYDIEAGTPYLFVDKLSIQSPEDFGEPESGRMRMSFSVVGQWRASE